MTWNKERFFKNISELQKTSKKTQKDMEDIAGMYNGFMAKMKAPMSNLQPSAEHLLNISNEFGYTIDELLKDDIHNVEADEAYVYSLISKLEQRLISEENIWEEIKQEDLLRSKGALFRYYEGDYDDCELTDEAVACIEINQGEAIRVYDAHNQLPPMLMYHDGKEGKGIVYFDSPFHSAECTVAGECYLLELDVDKVMYLLKVGCKGKEYYELYLVNKVFFTVDDLQNEEKYFNSGDGDYDYYDWQERVVECIKKVQPISNSYNKNMEKRFEHLYNAISRKLHRPKLTGAMKEELNKLVMDDRRYSKNVDV